MTLTGKTVPRLHTEPLPGRRRGDGPPGRCPCGCLLDETNTYGFEVVDWARDVLGVHLNPWQVWLLVHALELDEACETYRFRTVIVLVARQNGKTLVKAILTLWRMIVRGDRYLIGTAQDLSQAREVMNEVLVPTIIDCEGLRDRFNPDDDDPDKRVGIWHKTLNDEYFRLDSKWSGGRHGPPHGPRYLIKALNRKAGRGLSGVAEVNIDELREQRDFQGWGAISKVIMAAAEAQIWCMSNAGDKESVLLNHLRGIALSGTDPQMFHAEWSGEEGCELDDRDQWAQANPSLGYTLTEGAIESALRTDPPAVFRTEVLCQFVDVMNTAVDMGAWAACADPSGRAAEDDTRRPAICVEAAADGEEVVAVLAVPLGDGRVRVQVAAVWPTTAKARDGVAELRSTFGRRVVVCWYPNGPTAKLGAALRTAKAETIKGTSIAESCMTFADLVDGRQLLHPDDGMLNSHVSRGGMVGSAKSWVFDRVGTHGLWAAAGAVHMVLNGPKRSKRRIIVAQAP